VGDLETLRDQLVRLVNQKMDAIDKRIDHTRKMAEPLIAQFVSENSAKAMSIEVREPIGIVKPKVPDISDMLRPEEVQPAAGSQSLLLEAQDKSQSVVTASSSETITLPLKRKPPEQSNSSDPHVEQLQKELLDALDRLEKLDVDSA